MKEVLLAPKCHIVLHCWFMNKLFSERKNGLRATFVYRLRMFINSWTQWNNERKIGESKECSLNLQCLSIYEHYMNNERYNNENRLFGIVSWKPSTIWGRQQGMTVLSFVTKLDQTISINSLKFYCDIKKTISNANIFSVVDGIRSKSSDRNMPMVLITDKIYPKLANTLSDNQINWIDKVGNCDIRHKSLIIKIAGQKRQHPH